MSGYSSTALTAEPLWVTAARQGLDVSVASATQLYPFDPFLGERRFGGNFGRNLTLLDGYQAFGLPAAVYTARDLRLRPSAGWQGPLPAHVGEAKDFDLVVDGARIDGLVYDDPADPVRGFDTMRLALGKHVAHGIVLKPGAAQASDRFPSLTAKGEQGDLGLHFRLFDLSPDASEILLFRAESRLIHSNKPLVEVAALAATQGFIGNGADDLYLAGAFGPPIPKGGDGTAEARYIETVELAAVQCRKLLDFALEHTRWDLLIAYLPYPDEALHAWLGYLDPTLSGHDASVAARLRPFMDQILRITDDYVGHVREGAGADSIVTIAADHGMVGTNRSVQFNVALQKAGLLTLAADGSIDLFRTRAVYFPGNQGYFLLNRLGHQQGIVRREEEDAVLRELEQALRRMRDPETQRPIVTAILDPRTWKGDPAIGGPQGGDLYMSLAPGYRASADLQGDVVKAVAPKGDHMFDPERREMQAGLVMAGPGVSQGADLGLIRQIDIAPTLCALLGIDPPAQATGSVLATALSRSAASPP
jgi:predicted AlkP superfamily phosphohydrolase/phosphomutase